MTKTARVLPRLLLKMLGGLGTLALSPIGRKLLAREFKHSSRFSRAGKVVLAKINLMYDYFRDPAEPLGPKMLVGAALLFLVMPNKFIRRWTTLIGLTDEFAAIAIIWQRMQDIFLNYEARRAERIELFLR